MHLACPAFIHDLHPNSQPITSAFPLEDAEYICKVHWPPSSFEFYSLDMNGDLYILANCDTHPDVRVLMPDSEDEKEVEF